MTQGALTTQQQQQQHQEEPQWTAEPLPLVVFPRRGPTALLDGDWSAPLRACVDRYLSRLGSIMFRGFQVHDAAAFQRFAQALDATITPVPVESIWCAAEPGKLWVGCTAGSTCADTLIADNREIYRHLSAALRTRLVQRGLRYARTFHAHSGTRWQDIFRTDDRASVEAWCRDHGTTSQWLPGHGLRIERDAEIVTRHPRTSEPLWAASVPLSHPAWHAWGDQFEAQDHAGAAIELLYADGSPVEHSVIAELVAAFTACASAVDWEPGDVLVLDRLVTSARIPDARWRVLSIATDAR